MSWKPTESIVYLKYFKGKQGIEHRGESNLEKEWLRKHLFFQLKMQYKLLEI